MTIDSKTEDLYQRVTTLVKEMMPSDLAETNHQDSGTFSNFSSHYFYALSQAVEKAANQVGVPVSMSVVNLAGHHLFHYKMEDALLVSIGLAKKKAYTTVAMKMPTHELAKLVLPGAPLYQLETGADGELVTFGGGLPILNEAGQIIGGLGISGATVCQDIAIGKEALLNVKMR